MAYGGAAAKRSGIGSGSAGGISVGGIEKRSIGSVASSMAKRGAAQSSGSSEENNMAAA